MKQKKQIVQLKILETKKETTLKKIAPNGYQ